MISFVLPGRTIRNRATGVAVRPQAEIPSRRYCRNNIGEEWETFEFVVRVFVLAHNFTHGFEERAEGLGCRMMNCLCHDSFPGTRGTLTLVADWGFWKDTASRYHQCLVEVIL